MLVALMTIGLFACTTSVGAAQVNASPAASESPSSLVREVVYNELHDHSQHGFFRYWIERSSHTGTSLEEQVETADGPIARMLLNDGHPLDPHSTQQEEARLQQLLTSPAGQASRRDAYRVDEQRIGRILALLPDAFVYQDEGENAGIRHLRYLPNPNYSAHSVEARIFHAMSGDLWVDTRAKRMQCLEGHLTNDVLFGFGLLGRVNKGSWFRMMRVQVSPTDWKTDQLELHMSGRALIFKTLARNTSEHRGGFASVPALMSLAQGLEFLEDTAALREAAARVAPAALTVKR